MYLGHIKTVGRLSIAALILPLVIVSSSHVRGVRFFYVESSKFVRSGYVGPIFMRVFRDFGLDNVYSISDDVVVNIFAKDGVTILAIESAFPLSGNTDMRRGPHE